MLVCSARNCVFGRQALSTRSSASSRKSRGSTGHKDPQTRQECFTVMLVPSAILFCVCCFNYTGRVEYRSNQKDCTLRITELRESDSAVYKFRFITNQQRGSYTGSPGVTLTVTDLQVQVITSQHGQDGTQVQLKCHSSCLPDHPSYVWMKNGQVTLRETSSTLRYLLFPEDNISCALKGHEEFPSPSVYAPKPPSVSVSPSGEITEATSVTLTCSSDANPAASYTWYKEDEDSLKTSGHNFTISNIRPEHSGSYYCVAHNNRGTHNSTLQLTVAAVRRISHPTAGSCSVTSKITLSTFYILDFCPLHCW
uniref:B-cell receptor CD22 n=1 Tax=Oreochromis aureus TaxID=47969 RepID=A0A668RLJ4_OREAU